MTSPLRDYLRDLQQIGVSESSRQRLIESHLSLVVRLARRYQHRGLSMADLVQEGNLALTQAADRYDASRGVRFSTYAYQSIRGAMVKAILTQVPLVPLPLKTLRRLKVSRCRDQTIAAAQRILTAGRGESEDLDRLAVKGQDEIERQETSDLIRRTLDHLPDREAQIARLALIDDLPLTEIGRRIGRHHTSVDSKVRKLRGMLRYRLAGLQ